MSHVFYSVFDCCLLGGFQCCPVTKSEAEALFIRYFQLKEADGGDLSRSSCLLMPELAFCPVGGVVLDVVMRRRLGNTRLLLDDRKVIDFKTFVQFCELLSRRRPLEDKVSILFDACDVKGDGVIPNQGLLIFLKRLHGADLTDAELQRMTDLTMAQFDDDADGCLAPREFSKLCCKFDLEELMSPLP